MWQRYLLPWEGSDLSVGEHCFDKVCVGTASVSASMCVCECMQKAARVKDKGNVSAIKRLLYTNAPKHTVLKILGSQECICA